jgi:hypothetical protein
MQFFFPDSQDQIDPGFDFVAEERSPFRVRQRDDRYAHEVLAEPAFDGILVSKTIVDGSTEGAGKYSAPQRHRFYRAGVRRFFRLDEVAGPRLDAMGDCGAFTYVREDVPPFSPDQVIDFYEDGGFDLGLSVDHIILGFDARLDDDGEPPADWVRRRELTVELAAEFLARHRARGSRFIPVGVAQGWSPASYADSVAHLQAMGYDRVALGGMAALKTSDILAALRAVADMRRPDVGIHLLGITRCEHLDAFAACGVTSFDSTSPFRQSFKDDKDNYYGPDRTYIALRVPQVDGNPRLKARIRAGRVDQALAVELEQRCLHLLRAYDAGEAAVGDVIGALARYEEVWEGLPERVAGYEEFLTEKPWKTCPCGICAAVGIEIAIFRGSERNKRRGFHNLFVFRQRLERQLAAMAS